MLSISDRFLWQLFSMATSCGQENNQFELVFPTECKTSQDVVCDVHMGGEKERQAA